ncbi:MAG: phosphotransferase [Terriglobia bacterium]
MQLSTATAGAWLARHNMPVTNAAFHSLGGGVSNTVILVEGTGFRGVIKQSLGQLRVEEEWLSSRARVLREAAAMRWLSSRISRGRIPAILVDDPSEFAILMEAAPRTAAMWKTSLLRGYLEPSVAVAVGELLASVISVSWNNPEAERPFHDQTVFEELRVDPYYRFTSGRHPEVAHYFLDLIERSATRRVSLVHGDFSPKNLLIDGGEVWAIDWEVVHFGDPAFDVAFLWTHLLLKSIYLPRHAATFAALAEAFTRALRAGLPPAAGWVCDAALEHLPALLLARVDGKSPAEYLDADMRNSARALALALMREPARSVGEIFER